MTNRRKVTKASDLAFFCRNEKTDHDYSISKVGPVWTLYRDGVEVHSWPNLIAALSALERYASHNANEFKIMVL